MAKPRVRFTRADYEQLPEHLHAELIEGDLVMVPAPTPWHERLAAKLMFALHAHLGAEAENRVLGSRIEISVWEGSEENIILPDVVVLPEGTRPTGADWRPPTPLWVAEVLSPSTAPRDRGVKLRLYARAGIAEAWLIDPEAEVIEVHDLAAGGRQVLAGGEEAVSRAVSGFRLAAGRLFAVR
ncbi:MAG: Uma2 family endonuclease [Planctomycetota bacterium]|jgi:Uma2 family endonuclease